MKRIVFVTGYPRTRTCWMSELLTVHGHSFAFHEASIGSVDLKGWRDNLSSRPEEVVIDCNSAALYYRNIPGFKEIFHDASYVLVMRPKDQCLASFQEFLGSVLEKEDPEAQVRYWNFMEAEHLAMERDPEIIKIPYESLDEPCLMKRVCQHIVPSYPWDLQRFEQLKLKKVSQNVEAILQSQNSLVD